MPPSKRNAVKKPVAPSKRGPKSKMKMQVEEVQLKKVVDDAEDFNSDQDPDDPDSLSDKDPNSDKLDAASDEENLMSDDGEKVSDEISEKDPDSDDLDSLSDLSDEIDLEDAKKNNDSPISDLSDTSDDEPLKEVKSKKCSAKQNGTNKLFDKSKKETTDKNKNDFIDTSSDEAEPLSIKKSKKGRLSKSTTTATATAAKVVEQTIGHAVNNGITYHTEPCKRDPTKTVVVMDKPKPVFTKTKPVETTSADPESVTFNQYYRHKCKLAKVKTAKQITGQDLCQPGRPAELPLDKLKLHYVVHYLYRGTWDTIVPEEDPKCEGKIECYICNICHKRFKNHLERKEYPGRGSVLCHLATDHGLLLEAMSNEKAVNLEHDIKILVHNDKQFKESYDNGADTARMNFQDLVSSKESMLWRLTQAKKKAEQDSGTNGTESSTHAALSKAPTVDKPSAVTNIDRNNLVSTVEKAVPNGKPSLLECPHCDELKGNDDAPNLRLHIFHHYEEHWAERISQLSKGDRSFFCDRCPRKKKITGATPEGTKTAVVCHFAIQHYELRGVLEKDERLQKNFVKDLYWDHDNPNSVVSSYFQSQSNLIKSQSTATGGRPATKKATTSSDSENTNADTTDLSSLEMSLSDDELKNSKSSIIKKKEEKTKKPKKRASNGVKKSTSKSGAILPGETNPNYIRKRTKINFTLDSDDDSASDHEWEKSSKSKSSKSAPKKRMVKPMTDEKELEAKKERVLPKRNATKTQKVWSFLNEEEEDE